MLKFPDPEVDLVWWELAALRGYSPQLLRARNTLFSLLRKSPEEIEAILKSKMQEDSNASG